jgi:hypothetical protein
MIEKLKRMEEEEKRKRFHQKQLLHDDGLNQYYTHLSNKQRYQDEQQLEKMRINGKVTLNINHEERLNQMKDYFMGLNEKVDSNVNIYNDYNRRYSPVKTMSYNNVVAETPLSPLKVNRFNDLNKYSLNSQNNLGEGRYFHPGEGPVRTDVASTFDKLNHRDYQHYKDINQQFYNYNRELVDDNTRVKEDEYRDKRVADMERIRDLDRYEQANQEAKNFRTEQQKLYHYLLDNQVRVKEDSGTSLYRSAENPKSPCI